jgi:O-antigen/teichoic acid export membrane protein
LIKPGKDGAGRARLFLVSVLWNWITIGTNFAVGFVLARYIVRKLGEERYGLWALAFALIEYFILFDLGLRSAVVNFVSRLQARGESEEINRVLNTALVYMVGIAGVVVAAAVALSGQAHRLFQIGAERREEFETLVLLIGINLAAQLVFTVFQAALEAFQQFKTWNRIAIVGLVARATGCFLVVYLGHGLVAMGMVVVVSQWLVYGLNVVAVRRIFPAFRLSFGMAQRKCLREMAGYGLHSVLANTATIVLNQGPLVMVGHFRSEAYVGYYSVPSRLLQYAVEMIARIGFVTAPNTAELVARGKTEEVAQLGMTLNRYCFALFLPFSMFLAFWGRDLIGLWLGQGFAVNSGPLVGAFALSTSFAMAGQFNSSSMLFGMARHDSYAKIVMVEAAALVAALAWVLPHYGIQGGAWAVAALMIVSRGLATPWVLCERLHFSYFRYMAEIYWRPLLGGIPLAALMWVLKNTALPGATWFEVFGALAVTHAAYYGVCYFTCLSEEHRRLLWDTAVGRLKTLARPGAVKE